MDSTTPQSDQQPTPQTEKVCAHCEQSKPLTDFSANSAASDGLQAWCKACHSANHAERRSGEQSPLGRPRIVITKEQREIFLRELERTGEFKAAAAKCATGIRADGKPMRYETWRDLYRSDLEFRQQCEDARALALGSVVSTLRDRMDTPDRRPVVNKQGEIVGHAESWFAANQVALRLAEKLDPAFAQRKHVTGEVTKNVNVSGGRNGVLLSFRALERLPEDRKSQLAEILRDVYAIEQQLEHEQQKSLPAPAEQAEGEIVL